MDTMLAGTFSRESEFVRLPSGNWLTGACGPNALSQAWAWATQQLHNTIQVYAGMLQRKLCDSNGVTSLTPLSEEATALGLHPQEVKEWAGDSWPQWRAYFLNHLNAGQIVLFETAHGQALVDELSGAGENAVNLRYHFLLCVGRRANGNWVCIDGCNLSAVSQTLQEYSEAAMTQAMPCAAFAIPRIAPLPKPHVVTTTGAGAGFDAYCAQHGISAPLIGYGGNDLASMAAYGADTGLVLVWVSGEGVGALTSHELADAVAALYPHQKAS